MKKLSLTLILVAFGLSAMAQQIQLRSADKAECVKSDMTGLKASFSFSTIAAEDYGSERGTFSWLSMPNTVIGGNEGEPQIPVVNQLIAVPFGAQPRIEITSYSTTDYRLEDLGIHTLVPRQPSLRKDQRPEDVPFVYNASAYQTRGLRSTPQAVVSVEGTMRGVQLGKMTIEPVSYDPVNNTLRVFNDIEVEVHFDDADAQATEDMLVKTYSPYFDIVYKSLFNGRAVMDAYSDHPDLYRTPVKMLVVTTSTFTNSTEFQNWLTWKKQKGIEVDVQTVTSSTSSSDVRSLIQSRYNANYPTFLVIVGDESVVKNYTTYTVSGLNYNPYVSDLQYASIDSDVYHDMYYSRMPVATATQLGYLVNKILMYEQYTMTDPSYLNKALLIAGWDSNWTAIAGKPTINYAANNYFNTAHGITPYTYITTGTGQTTCYNYISQVGFVNYTAHGDIQEWADPEFTNSQVNSLSNTGNPFWAMGNCCLTANFGNSSYSPCFGEAMVRANNKGAFGYIGSVPESYWFEDLYFGVGAFAAQQSSNNNPTVSGTTVGCYDAMFDETGFNCLNSVPYIGNVAVTYAHAHNYNSSVSDEYYWRAYQCFGDGSVMPYLKVPDANNVSHANTISEGVGTFRVNADAMSYVSITVNNEIIGVAAVPANATYVDVPFTTAPVAGQTAMVVVTRNQRQPYINNNVPIVTNAQYTISANANPNEGGTVTGGGTYYGSSNCTLTATANQGYVFDNWTKDNTVVSTEASFTFEVTENATYTANFTALAQYTINANANPSDGGSVSGSGTYYAGDNCTLTATANHGYAFNSWNNGSTVNPLTFTVTSSATFTANFDVLTLHSLSYNTQQDHGTISVSADEAYLGDVITLTATPDASYHLDNWEVRDANNNTITVSNNQFVMPDSDVTISASFKAGYDITVLSLIGGNLTASASTADAGQTINLTATPNSGYEFMEWNVYQTGEPSNTVTVTNNRFTMPEYDVTVSAVFGEPTMVEHEIGVYDNSTIASNTYFPSVSSVNYSLTEQIYTASEIGSNAGSITGVEFYYNSSTSQTRNLDIYMVSTSNTNFSSNTGWIKPSASNKVYSGSVTFSQGWNEITFSTDFTYDGTKNVALIVDDNTNSSQSMEFLVYTGSSNSAIYVGGSSNYNPTSISTSTRGTRASTKNAVVFHVNWMETLPVTCEGPTVVVTGNYTPTSAAVYWAGESSSYNVRYRNPGALFYDGFEDGLGDWTIVASSYSSDATNWKQATGYFGDSGPGPHSGSYVAMSRSYDGSDDQTVDNWLISPKVTLDGELRYWVINNDGADYVETYDVYVSTTGNSVDDFSLLYSPDDNTSVWLQKTVDLSSFNGVQGYIAFRHHDSAKDFLIIDDFGIYINGSDWIDLGSYNEPSVVAMENLESETTYEVQVQGICEGMGESDWQSAYFTTLSWCSTPTALTASDVAATSANASWTGYQDSYTLRYRTAGNAGAGFFDDFESSSLNNWQWTTYTNGDAFNNYGWFAYAPTNLFSSGDLTAYSGSICAISFSYDGNSALSADNWLVTPQVDLGGTLKFWVNTNASYPDSYEVLLSTGGNAITDFTITLQEMAAAAGGWNEVTIDLSRYEGQTGYVAIHHVSEDAFYLLIDDFGIYGDEVPAGEWQTLREVTNPFTISGLNPETAYEFQVMGNCSEGTTDWSASATFTTGSLCDAPVGMNATGVTASSATLNWAADLDKYNLRYTPATFFENFENGAVGWRAIRNGEGTEYTDWRVINSETAFSSGAIPAHSGSYVVMSRSYSGQAYNVDNWLISPCVNLDGYLKFWVMDDGQYHEHFDVYVSTTGTDISDFTLLYEPGDASAEWTEVVVDLRSYGGTQGYIAIRNIDNDQDFLFLDDFGIYPTNNWTENNRIASGIVVNGLDANTNYIWQVQGVNCDGSNSTTDWSSYASFTTAYVLTAGSNWWTPTTTMTLEQLEEALGNNAVLINSQDGGFARYEDNAWSGTLTSIEPGKMYKIETNAACSLALTGTAVGNVEITILPGYNWFGYTGTQAADIATALGSITPASGDTITDQNGNVATFTANNNEQGGTWSGDFNQLQKGHGYVYYRQQ